ncbi:MAG: type II toxin-antitoxin system mRNA interferase toxin, RelE/StbE family [Bacteroidota bacterium]
MSNDFQIAETENFSKKILKPEFKVLYNKIKSYVYPQLRKNPFFGLNIKKLKGEFKDVYRYRIADFRLFYTIVENKVLVIMLDLAKRKDSY